jgi:hypothetical protein
MVTHDSSRNDLLAGPEGRMTTSGGNPPISTSLAADNGISIITAPMDALLGVFLGSSIPNVSPAPKALDFSSTSSRDFSTLAPLLKQVFFIGDGVNSSGAFQSFIAPAGTTRLFLGVMDDHEWRNNAGSFAVTVSDVPEPPELATMIPAVSLFLYLFQRKRRTLVWMSPSPPKNHR